MVLLLGAFT
jgi:hypothetical protein